jgi:hypothetical protein
LDSLSGHQQRVLGFAAVEIADSDFASGGLARTSYLRPGKLFSANTSIMNRVVGTPSSQKQEAVVDTVIAVLRPDTEHPTTESNATSG